jgi:glycerate dehydrogenase
LLQHFAFLRLSGCYVIFFTGKKYFLSYSFIMVIVITDGYTLNPGDLSWDAFKQIGEVKYYDRTGAGDITERCREATIIITNKTPLSAEAIEAASKLKVIAVTATGYNIIDTSAAKQKGIIVCNVPEYGTDSVAQHTIALLLELTNSTGIHSQSVLKGEWEKSIDWSYTKKPVTELSGKTIGIVGFGRIGRRVAEISKAFGMKVIFYSPNKQSDFAASVSLHELFSESDVISLHCPLKPDNREFVNKDLLSLVKSTAFLINTSRGQLINEEHLADVLKQKKIAGAAVDVLSIEPPFKGSPLIGLSNCVITPHIAWKSFEARQRLLQTTLDNVKAALAGRPQNVVNA